MDADALIRGAGSEDTRLAALKAAIEALDAADAADRWYYAARRPLVAAVITAARALLRAVPPAAQCDPPALEMTSFGIVNRMAGLTGDAYDAYARKHWVEKEPIPNDEQVRAVPPAQDPPAAPVALTAKQQGLISEWAADDRLWTTQETVEFNLRVFARAILTLADRRDAAAGPSRREPSDLASQIRALPRYGEGHVDGPYVAWADLVALLPPEETP